MPIRSSACPDVLILGSGMAGSLTALVLDRLGLEVAVIDRGHHPRFAVGESSTPIADRVLLDLASRYDLPHLRPLASFGAWQRECPDLLCGRKRGFSYFHHREGEPFRPDPRHRNELLVAASADDEHSDTHWLRADVDRYLAQQAAAAGVTLFEDTEIREMRHESEWRIEAARADEPIHFTTPFLIDASGPGRALVRALDIGDDSERLSTRSRTIYSHFRGVRPWQEILAAAGADLDAHPFPCDHAAQHHVLDGAWMWNLRFDNDVVSAGLAIDLEAGPPAGRSAAAEWSAWLGRYPSLGAQLAAAELVEPPGCLLRTGRLQRLAAEIAGPNWLLLPHTAGFVDPLHSTGIAHSLCGIERLARLFAAEWGRDGLQAGLRDYAATVRSELLFVDRLVHSCYLAGADPRLFHAACMPYFAAATTYEQRRHGSPAPFEGAFLCADDPELRRVVEATHGRLRHLAPRQERTEAAFDRFEDWLAGALEPFNRVGLCDPEARNMYRYTAAPDAS